MATGLGISNEAAELHRSSTVIDLHADTLIPVRAIGYDLSSRHRAYWWTGRRFGHCDLPRFREGGCTGQFFGLVTSPVPAAGCVTAVMRQIALLSEAASRQPDELRLAWSAEDLDRGRDGGPLAAFMGIEGAHNLEGEVANVARFARAGVRYIGLAHFSANAACAPAFGRGADNDASLTPHGCDVVDAMGEHRVLVDLAHAGRRAFLDAARRARPPVIVSHTGVAGAHGHWRNIDDEQLRAVAETDGVLGVIFAGAYLGGRTVAAVVAHMEHIRRTVGVRHVALGSDYDGAIVPVRGLDDISMLPHLTDALLRAGWPSEDIRAALGGNVRRVLAASA